MRASHIQAFQPPRRREWLIVIACLLVGFALRFYAFDQKSLWMDEIYTFNDSRDDLGGQIEFYKENPTYLHPPLFFILTHPFHPSSKPERDLRILPLIFGTLSIPMIYYLSKSFSPHIALPCTLSLTFMTYHISLSQEGRSYTMVMFFGMVALYFLIRSLTSSNRVFLCAVSVAFTILFYTSYTSIPFIVLSQFLWFYPIGQNGKKASISSLAILNGLLLLFCLPWLLFLALHFKGQPFIDPLHTEGTGSLLTIFRRIFNDWFPEIPLTAASVTLLILFPLLSNSKRRALVLLALLCSPVVGVYLFCQWFDLTHFISSKYFITFLPPYFIVLYLSLNLVETKFQKLSRIFRPKLLFTVLLLASNLMMLPLYYHSGKQDFRGLVAYLKSNLRQGDKIFSAGVGYMSGILHYFGVHPEGRHYEIPYRAISPERIEFQKSFSYGKEGFTIYSSKEPFSKYVADGSRLWIVVGKENAKRLKQHSPFILKGYFDGSFANFVKFPDDASIYLFLYDPKDPEEKGIDLAVE